MPGFSLGCPQKLRVAQQRGKRDRPTTILAMALDPSGHFLAVLTRHELQVSSSDALPAVPSPPTIIIPSYHHTHREGA